MNQPLISIIIPVYNAEKYLRECLDTVLAQSFTDFEVLIINDGSTDSSRQICDEYAEKDKRIKVFHKENGGVSAARNLGIENAKGEWITFVDSDDKVNELFLEKFEIEKHKNLDIFIQSHINVYENNTVYSKLINDKVVISNEIGKWLEKLEIETLNIQTPWAKLFKKELITQNSIRFNEDFSNGEDHVFVLNYFKYITRLIIIPFHGYCYNRELNSLSRSLIPFTEYYKYTILSNVFRSSNIEVHHMSSNYKAFNNSTLHSNLYTCISLNFKDTKLSKKKKNDNFKSILSEITILENKFSDFKRGRRNSAIYILGRMNLPFKGFLIKQFL